MHRPKPEGVISKHSCVETCANASISVNSLCIHSLKHFECPKQAASETAESSSARKHVWTLLLQMMHRVVCRLECQPYASIYCKCLGEVHIVNARLSNEILP